MFYAWNGYRGRDKVHLMAGDLEPHNTSGLTWNRKALCGVRLPTTAFTITQPHPSRNTCRNCKQLARQVQPGEER